MTTELILQESLTFKTNKIVGIAADHGGYELKKYLAMMLREAGAEVIDFGDHKLAPTDDYPDFVVPLARAVASGQVNRGVAICGSGVGACIVANKVNGVRACLIHDPFSAHQGVEDDDLNLICLGGLVVGHALAWELLRRFLTAHFTGKERHRRRLEKVCELENQQAPNPILNPQSVWRPETQAIKSSTQSPPLRIYLICHGETEWARSNRVYGLTDLPLTAFGEGELLKWGQFFCQIPFTQVRCSPHQCTRKTCDLLGLGELVEVDEDLVDWNYGDYEGLKSTEIIESHPDWSLFQDGCPHGESPAQISARADQLIDHLRTLTGNVALVSHSKFCGVLAARWIGLAVTAAQHFPLEIASLGMLGFDQNRPQTPVIELWNAGPHDGSQTVQEYREAEARALKQRAIQRWENEGGEIPSDP